MGNVRARAAAVVVLVLGFVAWLAPSPLSAAGPFSFPHRPHLSAAAIAACGTPGGSDADCRGCHDYRKDARDAHLVGCDKCHVDDKHLEVKRTLATTRPAFQHKEHLFAKDGSARKDITCFSCHAMRVDYDFIEFSVPTAGLGSKGVGGKNGGAHGEKTCADCHAAHETSGGLVTQDEKTGDGKACAVCHMKATSILPLKYRGDVRASAAKPFAHKDHGAASADCAACHDAIKKSRTIWDYDPTKGTADKCASCHVGAGGKPLVAGGLVGQVTKIDFSNFPHEKHLGEFSRMSCATCHYPETDEQGRRVFAGRAASPEPVGRGQLVNFKACDACHGHEAWAPGKPSWHVDGHGVGAWACFKCHAQAVDAQGKLKIAEATVHRTELASAGFAEHAHPGITGGGGALSDPTQNVGGAAKACSDCHLAKPSKTTSRLAGKAFLHAPHVPAQSTSDDCLACHPTSGTSRRSEDLQLAEPHGAKTTGVAARGCLDCHRGGTAEDLAPQGQAGRATAQFDHAGHVRAASLVPGVKGVACVECHVAGGARGYTTPADVLNCTKCHAHEGDAAKVARTGPKTSSGADAKACAFCHDQVRGGESEKLGAPPAEVVERRSLSLSGGVQFHDKTGDCAACHVRDGLAAAPYAERISSAKVLSSIHEDAAFADKPFNDPKGKCDECHRVEPRGYLKALKR